MRKFILWDHDGVLVDSEKWYYIATRECLAELDVDLSRETYLEFSALGRSTWELARERGISAREVEAQRRKRNDLYRHYLETKPIEIEHVVEVLSGFANEYRMAVVTGARREDFELIHRTRNLTDFFEFVVTADECTNTKPHPEPYLQALKRFGAKTSDAVAVEDSGHGLASAVDAGLDCVIVRNAFTEDQDFSRAWKVVDSVRDLPAALAS